MTVLSEIKIDINVDDVLKIMGYQGARPAPKRIVSAAHEAKELCLELIEPRCVYEIYEISGIGSGVLSLNGAKFHGKVLQKVMKGSTRAVIFVATMGKRLDDEIERLTKGGDTFSAVMLDTFGSVALGVTSVDLYSTISQNEATPDGYRLTHSFGPGECQWDIREQKTLFTLVDADSIGVTLTDTCLMIPKKSRSGIMGLGPTHLVSTKSACDLCDSKKCSGREMLQILGIVEAQSQ
jgi:hypothetical protein